MAARGARWRGRRKRGSPRRETKTRDAVAIVEEGVGGGGGEQRRGEARAQRGGETFELGDCSLGWKERKRPTLLAPMVLPLLAYLVPVGNTQSLPSSVLRPCPCQLGSPLAHPPFLLLLPTVHLPCLDLQHLFVGSVATDQMNTEDSMAEDPINSSTPTMPILGQPSISTPSSSFVFGPTAAPSTGQPFQFGSQQNQNTPQNPSLFQTSSSPDLGAGGSFSLGRQR
ncbi:hypothetical protein U1Q18_038784 [Sarracenia purpurea var. burkii]